MRILKQNGDIIELSVAEYKELYPDSPRLIMNQKVIVTVLDEFIDIKEKNPKPFRKYVGKLDFTSFNEINEALKDTEKVDFNEW